ncbi:heavy-metal-associated domain-containing protein [Rhizohabitans arisaemae]|uniref:heavy-metal-associated domain-containing protein n=1 Tax=Rhizohabitans arisaemae TaxID=2720610 RepID=UPI0024B1691B|nr:heavy metal-associated domain-containing protein [Rhizohabitans arisaemae]
METSTYIVVGMTCGGCVGTVRAKIGKLSGVAEVNIDLASGKVAVTGPGPIDDALIRSAVEDAGYGLVGS